MRRMLPAETSLPNDVEPTKLSGRPKVGWINRLKNSARNWIITVSRIRVFLDFLAVAPEGDVRIYFK